jgi:glutamyl-tRNA synthetase
MKLPAAATALARSVERWSAVEWTAPELHREFMALAAELDVSPSKLQGPIRVAVTGRTVGLPLFEVCEYLGREETLRRLREASAEL